MKNSGINWFLISADGTKATKLKGKPTILPEGMSLRLEEIFYMKAAYGPFHVTLNGAIGSAALEVQLMKIVVTITVEGTDLQNIEKVRTALKARVGVTVPS